MRARPLGASRGGAGARLASFLALAGAAVACASDAERAPNGDPSQGGAGQGGEGGGGTDEPLPPAPYPRPAYSRLSETGLFADIAARALADDVEPYAPAYTLWSDGADKQRWVKLPPGTTIDTSDMDRWLFPVGTQFFKQFSLDGVPLETRLIERHGEGRDDYFMGAFVWNADGTDAELAPDGQADVLDTAHDVPSEKHCHSCHNGEPGRVLGFSALQLGAETVTTHGGPTLASLVAAARLSDPPDPATRFVPPGDGTTSAAFAYLHANCGHCHNLRGTAWPDTQMVLRLGVAETDASSSELFTSLVDVDLQNFRDDVLTVRVVPGDPDSSALLARMLVRGTKTQMPPLGSEVADEVGVELVRRWIDALPN